MTDYPAGKDLIMHGQCPRHADSPISCTFCQFGHILECHYPKTCEEANCDHYVDESTEYEGDDDDRDR